MAQPRVLLTVPFDLCLEPTREAIWVEAETLPNLPPVPFRVGFVSDLTTMEPFLVREVILIEGPAWHPGRSSTKKREGWVFKLLLGD